MSYVVSDYVAKNYALGDTIPYNTSITLYYGEDPRVKEKRSSNIVLNYTAQQPQSEELIPISPKPTALKQLRIKRYILKDY